jgi:hypothetical protein
MGLVSVRNVFVYVWTQVKDAFVYTQMSFGCRLPRTGVKDQWYHWETKIILPSLAMLPFLQLREYSSRLHEEAYVSLAMAEAHGYSKL